MLFVKCVVLLGMFVCLSRSCDGAETVEVSGCIGSHRLFFKARAATNSATFAVDGRADYLAVTEVYPDTPEQVCYKYKLSAPGIGVYERSQQSTGFGPITYFVRVKKNPVGTVKITNSASEKGGPPVLISGVWGVTKEQVGSILARDRFQLMGLIPGGTAEERGRLAGLLAASLTPRPEYGISTGFSAEIRCVNSDEASVRAQLQACADWARKHKMPAMLGLVSWWSGTPLHEPDGLGGKFGDLKYQQVCYSPDVTVPENPALKELIGDRYDTHYGLSVPNQWSSTPWLTMNSKLLNDYRHKRFDEAVALIKEVSGGDTGWIHSIYVENEPRYWDTACEEGNPKTNRTGKTLWTDFNPMTVEDARKDGVELDPSDGLSNEELSWLHRNVGRYNQEAVDAIAGSIAARKLGPGIPLYTHSLQHRDMFPGGPINHPASEWAYARGARTGIEGMWSQPSDFGRVREWGRWANLNREENDGHHTDWHLWDLRVSYMMGSDLYNSYNWQAVGPERVFDYMNEFLRDLPVVTLAPAELRFVDSRSFKLKAPMKLQAFDRIDLPVNVTEKVKGSAFLGVAFGDGECFCSERREIDFGPGEHLLSLDFTTPAECDWRREALMVLYVFNGSGRLTLNHIGLNDSLPDGVRLSLDLRTQRALSLAVIERAAANREVPN